LRDKIDKLLSGKIGAPPKSQKELDQVYAEGKERYRFRRPPGYRDTEKGRDPTSQANYVNDLRFEREYGDLVAWKQILDYAKQRKVQHLILITDDEKEDWWLFIKEKTIGPRPELLDEITFAAGVKTFHMYTSERFLQFAQSHLQHQVTDQSIEQIRDVIEANSVEIFRSVKSDFFREQAIQSWLQLAHEESTISRYPGVFPRYVLPNADGVRVAYEVQLCPDPLIYSTLKDNVQTANAEIAAGKFDVFVVIFVLADEAFASELRETIQRMPDVHGPRISFIISIIVRRRDALGIQRAVLTVLQEFL
jgi:PIN domain-containing protein